MSYLNQTNSINPKTWLLPLILATVLAVAFCGLVQAADGDFSLRYAKGFTIEKYGAATLVTVRPPWETDGLVWRYLLVPKGEPIPSGLPSSQVIAIPTRRVISLSSTHLAFMAAAGKVDSLVGVADFKRVNSPAVRQRIDAGRTTAVGCLTNLRIETVMDLEPDLILLPGSGAGWDAHPKLVEADLPAVLVLGHLEGHPLGRLEWIKFIGLLLDCPEHARRLFDESVDRYLRLATKAAAVARRPKVITGAPIQGQWWDPRGTTYLHRLILDAGGVPLWTPVVSGLRRRTIDIETMYALAQDAQIWINTAYWEHIEDALAVDARFGAVPALAKGMMFNNNKRLNAWGGNDYWESGMLNPDVLLADLITIFHPEILSEHELTYYRRLARAPRS